MSGVLIENDNIQLWENFIKRIISFLDYYKVFLDSYVLDFFCANHWEKFPAKWQEYLTTLTPLGLSQLLDGRASFKYKVVPPLTLLAFRSATLSFALPRKPLASTRSFQLFFSSCSEKKLAFNDVSSHEEFSPKLSYTKSDVAFAVDWKDANKESSPEGCQHYLLEHIYRKHLKPKKQHEVVRLSQIAALAVRATNAQVLVDVGSGQGHLSRLLSYGFNIPCVCLDTEKTFIEGARKFDQQLEASLKKQKNRPEAVELEYKNGPRHDMCHLSSDLPPEKIGEMLRRAWPELQYLTGHNSLLFGLVGLHSCGDLGPVLLKLFTNIDTCRSLVLVSCCYMKLSTECNGMSQVTGYPLSSYVKSQEHHQFSYAAREMSCHALEAYASKLQSEVDSLKVHCYRAVLEELIVRKEPSLSHSGLRSVRNAHLLQFPEYAAAAVSRLPGVQFVSEEFKTEEVCEKLAQWMKVVVFFSIRLMLAPAVEALILLDRVLYLYENGHECMLAPVFDPILSPRNYVLVAKKIEGS